MPKKSVRSLRCPICRKVVLKSEPEFPFCSERCRTIDLGKWASGGYVVSSPIGDPDPMSDSETGDSHYPHKYTHEHVKKPN